jgi:hypothetical protein
MAIGNHILTVKSYSYVRSKIPKISCLNRIYTIVGSVNESAIEVNTNTLTIVDNFSIPIKLTAIEHQMPSKLRIIMLLKESVSDR